MVRRLVAMKPSHVRVSATDMHHDAPDVTTADVAGKTILARSFFDDKTYLVRIGCAPNRIILEPLSNGTHTCRVPPTYPEGKLDVFTLPVRVGVDGPS
jgi:hypothetical protein